MRSWTVARTTAPLVVTIALCAAGCGKSDTQAASDSAAAAAATASASAAPAAAAAPAPTSPTLNDAQIAHVVVTANSLDSAAGQLAKQKGASKAVKDFGQTMVTDHSGVNKQAVALATKLKVTPEDNDVSKQLKTGGDQNMSNLQSKTGAAFDSAYIDHEVAYHQAVLDALDKTLIPGAQNAELKDLLQKSRPAFVAHLERAKKVQGELGKPKA
jgi:putative membrane protein